MKIVLAVLLSVPAWAQFRSFEIRFEGVGCESCVASLPDRVGRIRGVESARVDGMLLRVKLAAGNRVRIEQVRDMIQQDGSRAVSATVEIAGEVVDQQGVAVLRAPGLAREYRLRGPVRPGPAEIRGEIKDLRAEPPLVIDLVKKD